MNWRRILVLICFLGVFSQPEPWRNSQLAAHAALDETPVIRLLVGYTQEARGRSCSVGVIRSQIHQAVQEINQSFSNSLVNARLELAGVVEVDYHQETEDLVEVMRALQAGIDDPFNQLHTLRDQLEADLVSLVVANGNTCYASDQMNTVSTAFAPSAYSVVRKDCMQNDLALAQAVGANLGAGMDWFTYAGDKPDVFSHGYVNVTAGWRTIMTTDDRCSVSTCQRLPYWSNPDINYSDHSPMGVPGTHSDCYVGTNPSQDCAANNAATLNVTAPTAAAFRTGSGEAWTPAQVLLVNDVGVGATGLNSYYTSALDGLGVSYDICSTGNPGQEEPYADDLDQYQKVIWFSGDNFSDSTGPGGVGESALATWLESDHCLLISSSDYAYAHDDNPTPFMQEYLGVTSVASDIPSDFATGMGPFAGLGEYNLKVPVEFSPEWFLMNTLQPSPDATVAFRGDAGDIGLFKMAQNYRSGYFAFPLEMLEDVTDRQAVLGRFLDTCSFNDLYLPVVLNSSVPAP